MTIIMMVIPNRDMASITNTTTGSDGAGGNIISVEAGDDDGAC